MRTYTAEIIMTVIVSEENNYTHARVQEAAFVTCTSDVIEDWTNITASHEYRSVV